MSASDASSSGLDPGRRDDAQVSLDEGQSEQKRKEMTTREFRAYNRMAETMELYHDHFRHIWRTLYDAVSSPPTNAAADENDNDEDDDTGLPPPLSDAQLLHLARRFVGQLTAHHSIEEEYFFPLLAERMPVFAPDSELHAQHHAIHEGLDLLEGYVRAVTAGEREMSRGEVREVMDSFGEVLWAHLEREVRELGPEKMRDAGWSVKEMNMLPM